ncbi:MAG: antibiotic biosynthesis monooxygenase [Bacteroidia bacterium]
MAIHVAITRKILPGKETEFTHSLHRFLGKSFSHHGVHGAAILSSFPGAEANEIGILRTFKDQKERDDFYASQQFKDWEAYASILTHPPQYRELTGLEAWFRSGTPPPRWKMAIITLCGVFPTSLLLYYGTANFLKDLPAPLRLLITASLMVATLTWLLMPILTRLAKPWLSSTS